MTTGIKTSDKAVISFANHRGNYLRGLARLEESLVGRFDGDFLGFVGEATVGAPRHDENPYAFKVFCWEQAIEMGYKQILWLDSSCVVIRDLYPVFSEIKRNGYIMQEAGHMVGNWCNDFTLDWFGITRDQAMHMVMYGNAGFLGLNFDTPVANRFFNWWEEAMEAGCFKGSWNNNNHTESQDERCRGSRHDMAAGSIIANKLKMQMKKGDEWLEYAPPGSPPKNDTIIIQAQGV